MREMTASRLASSEVSDVIKLGQNAVAFSLTIEFIPNLDCAKSALTFYQTRTDLDAKSTLPLHKRRPTFDP
jgi:hypothetical protein